MSKLAKRGINWGRIVPVDNVETGQEGSTFSKEAFAAFGYSEITDKILGAEELTVDEIELLISNMPLSVLLKLSSILQGKKNPKPTLEAALYLPVAKWEEEGGVKLLSDNLVKRVPKKPNSKLNISFDLNDFSCLEAFWPEVIAVVKGMQPKATLIAPSVDEVINWLTLNESTNDRELRTERLACILDQFKALGFTTVKETSYRHSLREVFKVGFSGNIFTSLDYFGSPTLLARELDKIRRFSKHERIDSWGVGCSMENVPANLVMMQLRTLACGSITFNKIKKRTMKAASHLPYELSAAAGQTGAVLGALDQESAAALQLPLYDDLKRSWK